MRTLLQAVPSTLGEAFKWLSVQLRLIAALRDRSTSVLACLTAGSPTIAVRVLELLPTARLEILGRIDIVRLAIG